VASIAKGEGFERDFANALLKVLQVVVADFGAFKWRPVATVLFDKVMLHTCSRSRSKNPLPIDDAAANLSEWLSFNAVCRRLKARFQILDMQERKTAGIPLEEFYRVFSRERAPKAIKLKSYHFRISFFNDKIVGNDAVKALKLTMVIMYGQLEPRLAALLPDLVQGLGTPLAIIEGLHGSHGEEVLQADLLGAVYLVFPFWFGFGCQPMGARTPQAVRV
jgi:hypothetical protein